MKQAIQRFLERAEEREGLDSGDAIDLLERCAQYLQASMKHVYVLSTHESNYDDFDVQIYESLLAAQVEAVRLMDSHARAWDAFDREQWDALRDNPETDYGDLEEAFNYIELQDSKPYLIEIHTRKVYCEGLY